MNKLTAIIIFVAMVSGCQHNKTLEGIPMSESYNRCSDDFDFGELTTVGDPGDKFMITLPYKWDIQDIYSDTLYGIFASNAFESGGDKSKLMSLSVTGYKSDYSLEEYFGKEINSMKKSETIDIVEAGKITIDDKPGYWVSFELKQDDSDVFSVVVYLKKPGTDEIFLLQTLVFKVNGYEERICEMKGLIETFEFE